MSIDTKGEVHEFSFNTAYFTVEPRVFKFLGASQEAALSWQKIIGIMIREELEKLGGGIIWWRIKPEIECRGNLWHGYARFATSPALSEDFLTLLGKPEMQEELS